MSSQLPPEIQGIFAVFLVGLANWAKDELKERWQLRRKDLNEPINLMEQQEVEKSVPMLLEEILKIKRPVEIERTIGLIEQKKELVHQWKRAIAYDEKAKNLGRIDEAILQFRLDEYNGKIKNMTQQIVADIHTLGINIDKEEL